ncbi:GGDEF domain-containing protein [Polynucleobacter sp. MWH-Aus1W21]|uniref:GGDEF domain-containing protein n=1 Tax=Polynucleobacter sp. MWH-Aus1W21 TaxID=1855880 RepID=UPI001BFDE920|nr:GGDEF domain-containing protein [Polynucleobacter sp. MWH-Aus1W21]QWD67147.1 GGDEF domain-containing protein [Polynucleobacter sp. MWH-Aus1W21]
MLIAATLYAFSLCLQIAAAAYAINLFFRARAYRLACGFLALGLGLMTGRRISPLLHVLDNGHINLVDAALSIPISLLLLLGMFQFKNLLIDLEEKNYVLDKLSKTDSLTLALSRAETIARSELEIKKALRSKKDISFLMLDIDHFKVVNDTYGHPIGDQVLIALVKESLKELREIDICGRVGGEEFLIVLPETTKQEAFKVAERLREHIACQPLTSSLGNEIYITISIGISVFDPNRDKGTECRPIFKKYYAACDQAMYQAKKAGRNQTYS